MGKLDFYKERTEEALQEGFSSDKNRQDLPELWEGLKTAEGKYKKTVALVKIIKALAPEMLPNKILESLPSENFSRLPFNLEQWEFGGEIGKGGEHKVFLLKSKEIDQPSYVFKVNHQITKNVEQARKEAVLFKKEFEEIKKDYSSMPDLVPEELTIITTNLKRNRPSIVTIQKFFSGEIKCLFSDFKENERQELFSEDTQLLADLKQFYHIAQKKYSETGVCLDLMGEKNLSIIENQGERKLILLDPHNSVSRNDKDYRVKKNVDCLRKMGEFLENYKEH